VALGVGLRGARELCCITSGLTGLWRDAPTPLRGLVNTRVLDGHVRLFLLTAVVAIVTLSCADVTAPREQVLTLDVAPQQVPCTGVGPQLCLKVRQHPDTAWTLFYDAIEGFQFEEGFEYTLRVAVREVENPAADASSLSYRLLAILRKVPA
jgi:hypothetical protein